jgi:integrase
MIHRSSASIAHPPRGDQFTPISSLDTLTRRAQFQIIVCGLHWHDLRHEALSRLADDGVPVHELQLLAGHASIATTQLHERARERGFTRAEHRS